MSKVIKNKKNLFMMKVAIIILALTIMQGCGSDNEGSLPEDKSADNVLIAVKDASELIGTWRIQRSLFIFTKDGYFDVREIGADNLNDLNKGYSVKYFISDNTLYTQSENERAVKRGSPVYINKDRNMIYLYDDTNRGYYKIDMDAVIQSWDEEFVRVTNASQILGGWADKLGFGDYIFYENGDCDMSSFKRKYTIDNGNIYFFEGKDGYGNRMAHLSKDGSALYFNLDTNSAYFRKWKKRYI